MCFTGAFIQSQTIEFGYGIGLAVRLSELPDKHAIMAVAMDNSKIQLYIEDGKETDPNTTFIEAASLSGHEDWVRGLDFKADVGTLVTF